MGGGGVGLVPEDARARAGGGQAPGEGFRPNRIGKKQFFCHLLYKTSISRVMILIFKPPSGAVLQGPSTS